MSKKAKKPRRKSPLRISGRGGPEGTPYDEELAMMDDVLKYCARSAISEVEDRFPFSGAIWYGHITLSYSLEPWRKPTSPETGFIRLSRRRPDYHEEHQTNNNRFYVYYPIGDVLASVYIVVDSEDDEFWLLDDDELAQASDVIAASIARKLMNDCEYSYIARFRTMLDFIKSYKGNTFTKEQILKLTKPFGISDDSLVGKCLDYLYFNGQLTYKAEDDIRYPPSEAKGNPPFYFLEKEGD